MEPAQASEHARDLSTSVLGFWEVLGFLNPRVNSGGAPTSRRTGSRARSAWPCGCAACGGTGRAATPCSSAGTGLQTMLQRQHAGHCSTLLYQPGLWQC